MRTLSAAMLLMQITGLMLTSASADSSIFTNDSLKCEDICDSLRCFYPIYEEMLPDPTHKDCEAALYTLDGVVLDHSSLSANPANLSTRYCSDELLLKITCSNPNYQYQALYRVSNISTQTDVSATGWRLTSPGHLYLLLPLLIPFAVIICCI